MTGSTPKLIIAGTDTNIGKTIFAAMLTKALGGTYFKPIQAGLAEETDTETVQRLTGLGDHHILPELYRLNTPASPHIAAKIDGLNIETQRLVLPDIANNPLIVETAGGLLVPLTRKILQIEVIKSWNSPVILCARTSLGTINHTLLSVKALEAHNIPLLGIAFIGDETEDSERTIIEFSGAKRLGRLGILPELSAQTLEAAFEASFNSQDFIP